jgi:hypothetical protein
VVVVWDLRIDANLDGGRYSLVVCDQWQWRSLMSRTVYEMVMARARRESA